MLRVIRADEAVLAVSDIYLYYIWGATSEGRTRANMNPNLGHAFVIEMTTEEKILMMLDLVVTFVIRQYHNHCRTEH